MSDETIQVTAEQVMAVMQQLYPAEFGHAMATVEAQYWKSLATKDDDNGST